MKQIISFVVAGAITFFWCSFAIARTVSPPLETLLILRASNLRTDVQSALEHPMEQNDAPDECYVYVEPPSGETWSQLFFRVYGPECPPGATMGLVLLANPDVHDTTTHTDRIELSEKTRSLCLPSPEYIKDFREFIEDTLAFSTVWFNQNLAKGSFQRLFRLYSVAHNCFLPYLYPKGTVQSVEGKNPLKQYVFDKKILKIMQSINGDLYGVMNSKKTDWEKAWLVRDHILSIQQHMAMAIDDLHIVVKPGLRLRFDGYERKFRGWIDTVLLNRQKDLVRALSEHDVEESRRVVHSILYELRPALSGIISSAKEKTLYEELSVVYNRYIVPHTRERSLAFANHFSRIATLLAPKAKTDNYKMGFKISDVEFQFLKQSSNIVLHTDCSGFIGRIYRELARIAGMDMDTFVVSKTGVIGSIYLIEPKVSKKVELSNGENPCENMLTGDYFYFERKIRGKRQRHVIFFDRLVKTEDGTLKMSLWEASPGGVKHRIKPLNWVLRWVRSSYGAPRNGVYRLKSMDKIDSILERRGFMS